MTKVIGVYEAVADGLHKVIKKELTDSTRRAKVAASLTDWLVNRAKKKPVPDLPARLADWSQRIEKLVRNMQLDFSGGKIVIKTAGSDEQTLKALRFGSTWFEPNADLLETIMVGLFET